MMTYVVAYEVRWLVFGWWVGVILVGIFFMFLQLSLLQMIVIVVGITFCGWFMCK